MDPDPPRGASTSGTTARSRARTRRRSPGVRRPPVHDLAPPTTSAAAARSGGRDSQSFDQRYADLPPDLGPRTECLADVVVRMLPWWYDGIVPDLARRAGAGRRARQQPAGPSEAPRRHLGRGDPGPEHPDRGAAAVRARRRLPAAQEGGEYLDPEAAAIAIEAVKNQGRAPAEARLPHPLVHLRALRCGFKTCRCTSGPYRADLGPVGAPPDSLTAAALPATDRVRRRC